MGKRRVRDALAEGRTVVGFDPREDRRAEVQARFNIAVVDSFEALLNAGVGALSVSTPPDTHVGYYERCYQARLPFFSEANIFTPRASWFEEHEAASGVRGYASATWRYHPLNRMLRELVLALGWPQVLTISHQYAGYLPQWHPYEEYSSFYAGRPNTCAAREMVPFEAELLTWIFGPVRAVSAVRARRAQWKTPIDDTYDMLLEFESGVRGFLGVELHQVLPHRLLRVACRDRGLELDLQRHTLRERRLDAATERTLGAPPLRGSAFAFEDVYRSEMAAFLAALDGTAPYEKAWADDRLLSCLLVAAEESSRRRAWVTLAEAEGLHDGLQVREPAA